MLDGVALRIHQDTMETIIAFLIGYAGTPKVMSSENKLLGNLDFFCFEPIFTYKFEKLSKPQKGTANSEGLLSNV